MTVNKKTLRAAKEQLREDYEAAMREFVLGMSDEAYKVFCLGVTMAVTTLKDMAEEPGHLFPGTTLEESVEAYYAAAQTTLHAD